MVIIDANHAEQLAIQAKALKDRHSPTDKDEFNRIKNALLSQGYGALVRKYDIESWD